MLSDFGLSQLVSVPSSSWPYSRLDRGPQGRQPCAFGKSTGVRRPFIVCRLAVITSSSPTRLVTSRNFRAVCSSDFQTDVKALVDSTGEQRPDLDLKDLVDVCNDGLRTGSRRHAPSVTRHVRDRPSAPWISEEVRAARRQRIRTVRRWKKIHLTVHVEIFVKKGTVVRSFVHMHKEVPLWQNWLHLFKAAALRGV